jgi:ribosome biogenesis protein YTM1
VKFVTKNEAIRVTETPFAVPTRLNRQGLSQVVNHLLNTKENRPFDFLIDGLFLRSSLEKYMRQNMISEESVLTLEYVEAMPEPKKENQSIHPDWVSACALSKEFVATGCYDGIVRVYNLEGELQASTKAHSAAIKSISIQATKQNNYLIATSGKDQLGQLWSFNASAKSITAMSSLTGHLNSVDAIVLSDDATRLATASWDNTVRMWKTSFDKDDEVEDESQIKKKQKKTADGIGNVTFRQQEAEMILVGHTSYVTGVAFHPQNSHWLVSSASDRTVRIWDQTTHLCIQTLIGNRSINAVSVSAGGLVVTAHPDHALRLWDPRASDKGEVAIQRTFNSHKEWVSSVAFRPESEYLFASGAYDGTVKIWDMRSTIPLHTLAAHEGKVLDVAWRTHNSIEGPVLASGGEDKQLRLFSIYS